MADDRNQPATKGDVQDLEHRLAAGLAGFEQRIVVGVRMIIEASEKRILNAFDAYTKTEHRLNMPPQQ